jgi:hypothetical protein
VNQQVVNSLRYTAIAAFLVNINLSASADTRIRGEFEYNVDDQELSEWQIGPIFSLSDSSDLELEIPIGQDDGQWLIQPELTYEIEINDFTLELSVGFEAFFDDEPIKGFGSLEGSIDF